MEMALSIANPAYPVGPLAIAPDEHKPRPYKKYC